MFLLNQKIAEILKAKKQAKEKAKEMETPTNEELWEAYRFYSHGEREG